MAECKEKSRVSVEMKRDGAAAEEAVLVCNRKRKYCPDVVSECGGEVEESAANSMLTAALRTSGCSKVDGEAHGGAKRSWTETDLEDVDSSSESFEVVAEISTSINGALSREASSTTSELCGDSEDFSIRSPSRISVETPRRKLPSLVADGMPSAAELEDFFSAAEKLDQKRFAAKYNYDILKDVPLEGKYQWVRLRP